MSFAITIIHIILLVSAGYYFWRRTKTYAGLFLPALALKVLGGLGVGLIYKYYYTVGDTFNYFNEGKLIAAIAHDDFSAYLDFLLHSNGGVFGISDEIPRALFFSKIVSVFNLLTGDNYWIISIYFSCIGFAAAWFLFVNVSRLFPGTSVSAAIAILFFPSIVFWSSGIVKEAASTACVFFLSTVFVRIWSDKKNALVLWLLVPISAWVLWSIKYYVLGALLLVIMAALIYKFILSKRLNNSKPIIQIIACMLLLVLPALCMIFLHPNFSPERLFMVIVENNEAFLRLSEPGDAIVFTSLKPTLFSILMNSPMALFSGLYRPVLWEASNIFQLTIALENFLLLAVSLFSLRYIGAIASSPHRIIVSLLIFYVVALCVFLTLSSPNFGTLARYRVSFLPFFVLLTFSSRPMLNLLNRAFGSLVR